MEYLDYTVHFEALEDAEVEYGDTTLADFLSTEVTIDDAIEFAGNVYGTIEPDMIYEEYGSYQELYNEYIDGIAAVIVEEIENEGISTWFSQKITFVDTEDEDE